MQRKDLQGQRVFAISQFSRVACDTSSKGNLVKYSNGSQWVKVDHFGYESLAEVVSSRAALALGLNAVKYEPCLLDTEKEFAILKPACISDSFIPAGCTEVTLGRLLQQLGGYKSTSELYAAFDKNETPSDKINWMISLIDPIVDCEFYIRDLATLIWFDSLIYNSDRHLFNIVFLYQAAEDRYTLTPIFDCGAALLSDLEDFPLDVPVDVALRKVKSKPLSTSFKKQVEAFRPYLEKNSVDTVCIGVSDLEDYYAHQHIRRALMALRYGLANTGIRLHIEEQDNHATNFFDR